MLSSDEHIDHRPAGVPQIESSHLRKFSYGVLKHRLSGMTHRKKCIGMVDVLYGN
jgi:hypothetical protein